MALKDEKIAELKSLLSIQSDEIDRLGTKFKNQDRLENEIDNLRNKLYQHDSSKSPSEYIEQLKQDSSKTELVKNLKKTLFHSKHTGQTFNRNQRRVQTIFKDAMEWRNLL